MRRTIGGLVVLVMLTFMVGEATGEQDSRGHYCKQEMRDAGGELTKQHGFGYLGEGSGLPYTCGSNGCHQIPDWQAGSCSSHDHEELP